MSHSLYLIAAATLFSLMGCANSDADYRNLEARLKVIEAKHDTLLSILQGMEGKADFMARRMGWQPPPDTSFQEIPIGSSPVDGAKNPVLTIVEFSDLECHYCAQAAPILDSLVKTYPEKIRVVFKHYPLSFHKQARAAAAAAMAAENQGQFFAFRYRVAPHYRVLGDSLYLAVAKEIGLDMERFKREMVMTPEANEKIEVDMELGRRLGVRGTPTLFVNGKLAQDRSFEYFVAAMRQAEK